MTTGRISDTAPARGKNAKVRRVIVTLELDTDQPFDQLRRRTAWVLVRSDGEGVAFTMRQVSVNVIRAQPELPLGSPKNLRKGRRFQRKARRKSR